MSLCGMGIHAYRFVNIASGPDPLRIAPSWWLTTRCKRCRLKRKQLIHRYPRIIRT